MKARSFTTKIDLPAPVREKAIALLNQQLADTFDLFSQVKQAHWNVKGHNFIAMQQLLDDLAEEVEEFIDTIAERATALGGTALGTARMAAAASKLAEYPLDAVNGQQHIEALSMRVAALGKSSRAAIDTATEMGDA